MIYVLTVRVTTHWVGHPHKEGYPHEKVERIIVDSSCAESAMNQGMKERREYPSWERDNGMVSHDVEFLSLKLIEADHYFVQAHWPHEWIRPEVKA